LGAAVKAAIASHLEVYQWQPHLLDENVKRDAKCLTMKRASNGKNSPPDLNDAKSCKWCFEKQQLCIVKEKDKRPLIVPRPSEDRLWGSRDEPRYWL
jgi:hypothetical protein